MSNTENTRYVELGIVNDPAMWEEYEGDREFLQEKTVSIVATLQHYYLSTDFGSNIGSIQMVLSGIIYIDEFGPKFGLSSPTLACQGSATEASLFQTNPGSNYCEVQYASYLSNFQNYRAANLKDYDNSQLFSYYDFASSVIGYASLPGMCITSSSGGIEQCTYDDEYNGNIVAHEMGHNFNMQHDGNGNACSPSDYIMASVGSPYGTRPDSFSTCSVTYAQTFFGSTSYANTLKCLDNKPTETSFAVCRNGFVEEGESCDCGQANCAAIDPCCDGSTCSLYASAQCSNNDVCCEDCSYKSSATVCREKDDLNTCDIEKEFCTGTSAECPSDWRYIEGTSCTFDGADGYCYGGTCKSIEEQCNLFGAKTGSSYSQADGSCSGYSPDWQIPTYKCSNSIRCKRDSDNACITLTSEYPDDGIPCTPNSGSDASQCLDGTCQLSSEGYTYQWSLGPWEECSISCKENDAAAPGNQTRTVQCTLVDGTNIIDTTLCDPDGNNPEPVSSRLCNDFVCNFCKTQQDGLSVCGVNGNCDSEKSACECDSGYAGEFCDEAPGLNFTAIVSHAYKNVSSGETIAERANPCAGQGNKSVSVAIDIATKTRTVPLDYVDSISNLYVGATVGVRWTSAGDIELLAVGMIAVDDVTEQPAPGDWPFYVGTSLAADDSSCDDENSTLYDPCFHELSCNDFSFVLPTSTTPGTYKLIIRFNDEYEIMSPKLNVLCSENNCNSVGHGTCNADQSGCDCDPGWSGDSCSFSTCDQWSFAVCDKDEFGNCGSSGKTEYKPKCFDSTCDALSNDTSTNQCNPTVVDKCENPNFEGLYCELPTDYCSTLIDSACDSLNDGLCEWRSDLSTNRCLYKECSQFLDEESCEVAGNFSNYFGSNSSWSMFCEWIDDGTDAYCNRITCGDAELPECDNGAVRRPMFDEFSDDPISICRAWHCECSTVTEVADSYWTIPAPATLISSMNNYEFDTLRNDSIPKRTLTDAYIAEEALDLFTCSVCSLDCKNGATVDDKCQSCTQGCPIEVAPFRIGTQCDQVFWVGQFRLNVNTDVAWLQKWDEFEHLLLTDLAYFFSTDIGSVSIWQLKPDGDKTIVFFRYHFQTNDDDSAQITGGDIMFYAKKAFGDDTSAATRGFMMQFVDATYGYEFCIPTKEECDPDNDFPMMLYFYVCLGGSFGFMFFAVALYRILTRGKRQRAYEAKVREVRQAQLRLMEHHNKARRVGMRDVSKQRAAKIHKAHQKIEKEQKKELKMRAKQEKKLNKMNHLGNAGNPAEMKNKVPSHSQQDSNVELENFRRYSAQKSNLVKDTDIVNRQYAKSAVGVSPYNPPNKQKIHQGRQVAQSVHSRSRGGSTASKDPGANLPAGWKMFRNDDGIPYYFNQTTGQTTWRKPAF